MTIKNMNKLSLVGETSNLQDTNAFITINEDTTLNLSGKLTLYNYDTHNYNLELNLPSNTNCYLNLVKILTKDNYLNLNIGNDNNFTLELLIINEGNNNFHLNINISGDNNNVIIKARIINKNSKSSLNLICDGKVLTNTKDNNFIEDLKGLVTNTASITIKPNMFMDTNEVLANHLVTISSFNPDELFYLTTLGISLKEAQKMLINAFIYSIVNPIFKDLLNEEVIDIE